MSDTDLQRDLLNAVVQHVEISGKGATPSELLEQVKSWNADEFSVRDALWRILEDRKVELTAERQLVPTAPLVAKVGA